MKIFGIVLGVFLGSVLWRNGVGGALVGGLIGWLLWKVASLESDLQQLQTRLNQSAQKADAFPEREGYQSLQLPDQDLIKPSLKAQTLKSEADESGSPDAVATQRVQQDPEAEIHILSAASGDRAKDSKQTDGSKTPWQLGMDGFASRLNAMLVWFVSGNMLVRIGSIVLFFGAGFLLKYAAEHSQISIEIRMLGIVLSACVMLGVGWYLRRTRPVYGLALQGGGLGLLYLTIYASFRLYGLLAASHALLLLALVAGAGVAMAVIYNARWLAILSFAGGFLAPLLASTGAGSHVALFSWYAVLNVGIAVLAWHKAWRSLNLLGMIATFIIAAAWGNQYYQPEYFASVEPFLIGFGLLYLAVGVLFSLHRADPEQLDFGKVDASIIFGTPVGFFLLQTPLVHDFEHGMSLSALLAGVVYAAASWLAYRRGNKVLMLALISLSVTLITLAIPLEFDEAETAAAWAMEGVGLLWLGLRQKSQRALLTGLGLQILAAIVWLQGSPFHPLAAYGSTLSAFLIALSGWACAVLLGRKANLEKYFVDCKNFISAETGFGFQVWGLIWWIGAGVIELHRHVHGLDLLLSFIIWLTVSAWLVEGLSSRFVWEKFRQLTTGLILLWLAGLMLQADYVQHPAEGLSMLAWLPAMLTTYWMLYRADRRSEQAGESVDTSTDAFHIAGVCFALVFLIWEGHWQVMEWISKPTQVTILADVTPGIVAALLSLGICFAAGRWPVVAHRSGYIKVSGTISMLLLAVWFVGMSVDPVATPWPYIPLLNPLDVVLILAGFAAYIWRQTLHKHALVWFEPWQFYLASGVAGFIAFNADVARVVHHWIGIAWDESALMHSVELQAGLSLSWSVLALVLMSWASRKSLRMLWIGGAALLTLVVVKLFIIDMSGSGTVARIVSFLGVGGLLLVIGYFSPLPPDIDKSEVRDVANERKKG